MVPSSLLLLARLGTLGTDISVGMLSNRLKLGTDEIPVIGARSEDPRGSTAVIIRIVFVDPEPGFQPEDIKHVSIGCTVVT